MKNFNKNYFILISHLIVGALTPLAAQNAMAVSSNPLPVLRTAINWSPTTNATSYRIFRKNEGDSNYPLTPLATVRSASNCFTIKTLLINGIDSTAWKLVAQGLADSVLFNPCLMNSLTIPSEKYDRLQMLARRNMPIAKGAGLGYEDNTVVLSKSYRYRIVAFNAANTEIGVVATDLLITAGSFTPLAPPIAIMAEAGDAVVQVRWKEVSGAAGYTVERSTSPIGIFRRVNSSQYSIRVKNHLNGDTLVPNTEGFLDFQHYNANGFPISHLVLGSNISGPTNGVTYYYRIRTLDFFDRPGSPSALSNAATPRDSTPPAVANDLMTIPNDTTGHVMVRWSQVASDINRHREQPDSTVRYRLYRFESSENPVTTPSVFLGNIETIKGLKSKDTLDKEPTLRRPFGNKTWWYRLRSLDAAGNMSQWSAAVSALVKDTTPPDIVRGVATIGMEDRIEVKWKANTEPDIASYMVYRSLCHLGEWVECNPKADCKEWRSYNPYAERDSTGFNPNEAAATGTSSAVSQGSKVPCPCSGGFVFLGEITHDSVLRAETAGRMYFIDRTIPAGSPLCYAYWIKAKDSSDNISGAFPIPSIPERDEIVCQRLRDLTPPEPALISGLHARDRAIRVEWMGPPTQDTRAYHVYRAEGKDPKLEPPVGDFKWVGGMTIELPPALPAILTAPYKPSAIPICDRISVQATPWMSQGYFDDRTVDPKKTYWFRVVGIDYDGNETPLNRAAAISTFTFTRAVAAAPILDMAAVQTEPCGVTLQWSPTFDPSVHAGFIVYRSTTAAGAFTPIVVSPLKENHFTDIQVARGKTYWYRVATMFHTGRLSALTLAQSVTP